MAPPQKPETFMLSDAAQQSLPQDAQVALQQVDNCKSSSFILLRGLHAPVQDQLSHLRARFTPAQQLTQLLVKYFLISAPVDWTPDQYIRRFLLPTGEYVSCVLW